MYITAQDLYDEGLPTSYDEDYVTAKIAEAQAVIERITAKFFAATSKVLLLDGDDEDELQLPYPIVSVSKVEIKIAREDWDDVSLGNFEVYNDLPNDWQQPLIAIASFRDNLDVGNEYAYFPRGRRNVRVTGSFGWCLAGGETPPDIILATKLLSVELMPPVGDGSLQEEIARRGLKREDIDDYEYEWHEQSTTSNWTGNRSVDMLLAPYMGGPPSWSYVV